MLFSALPLELQNQVLINLDGISLAKAECVCEIWRELLSRVMYNLVWRRECLSTITESVLVEITGIENIIVCEPNSGIIRHDGSTTLTTAASTHVWKIIYKRWYTSRKVGQWPVLEREIQTQKGAVCDIKLLGEVIYTADLDGSITLWDSWTGVHLQSFEGHLSSVRSIALYPSPVNQLLTNEPCLPQLIISASEDRNICIWDVGTGVCKAVLCGHNNIVSCVAIYKDLIVSASFDETIKLWDLKKDPHSACVNTLKGHYSPVTYLSVWKTKALSVSYNAIKFWSLETGECLYTVKNTDDVHTSTTEGCVLRGCHALFVKSDGQLKFCDFGGLSSGIKDEVSCVYRLLDYSTTQGSRVSCFSTFGNLMAVGSDAGVVYIFHYRNDWSEKLSKLHCKVRTGHCGLCCVNLSNDGEGPVLAAGFHDGVVKIFRWFSPTLD